MSVMKLEDILPCVFSFVKNGSTFKSILFTCRVWHKMVIKIHPRGRVEFANRLTTLLKFLLDKPWNYDYLSQNPDKPWNYNCLSQNLFRIK